MQGGEFGIYWNCPGERCSLQQGGSRGGDEEGGDRLHSVHMYLEDEVTEFGDGLDVA